MSVGQELRIKPGSNPEQIPQGVLPVLQRVGDHRPDGAAELEAVAAAAPGDQHPFPPRGPVDDELLVLHLGHVGVEAGAATGQLSSAEIGDVLGHELLRPVQKLGRGFTRDVHPGVVHLAVFRHLHPSLVQVREAVPEIAGRQNRPDGEAAAPEGRRIGGDEEGHLLPCEAYPGLHGRQQFRQPGTGRHHHPVAVLPAGIPAYPCTGAGFLHSRHRSVLEKGHSRVPSQLGQVLQRLTAAQVAGPGVVEQSVLARQNELGKPLFRLLHRQLPDIGCQPAQCLPSGQGLVLRSEAAQRYQLTGLKVDGATGAVVPLPPLGGGPGRQFHVGLVRVVGAANGLGYIGAGGLGVGDPAALEQSHPVAALAQLQRGRHAEDAGSDDANVHGSIPYTSLLDPIDSEVPADLSSQNVVDFPVARNGRTPITAIISPPRVSSSFTDQFAALPSKVSQ